MMQEWFNDVNELRSVIDTRVVIVSCATKRYQSYELVTKHGIITNYRATAGRPYRVKSYAVKIIGTRNPNSDTGVFWFSPNELETELSYNIKNNIERNNTMEYYITKVIHTATKAISYVTSFEKFDEGDTIVVDYKYDNGALSVRYVCGTYNSPCPGTHVEGIAIGKVNRELYDTVIDRRKKLKELEAKLRNAAAACQEESLWRTMAEFNPAMAELLREYDEVKNARYLADLAGPLSHRVFVWHV